MVISKCVPLAISRKRFSEFTKNCSPETMIFVGYKEEDGKTLNVRMRYDHIKDDIIRAIKNDPEWGQGGSGGDDVQNPDIYQPVLVDEKQAIPVIADYDLNEDGFPIFDPDTDLDEDGNLKVEEKTDDYSKPINLQGKQGFVEINAGGNYTDEYLTFHMPAVGTITHVVVDYTGLPINETTSNPPKDGVDFHLYYGAKGNNYEILTVPPYCRGVVQILHTEETDIIVNASYTYAPESVPTEYVPDLITDDVTTNDPIDKTPEITDTESEYDIDMNEEKGYIEFIPTGLPYYTFWFKNPELGSSTYIVIDNFEKNYKGDVVINYGKRMKEDDPSDDFYYEVTTVTDERCVIEVFHSLSADIIVKVTKV